ncbi:MAG TPA: CpaD family pilus assembly protein [Rhizomicrobium sp.]|nr:CpaD family pilus assembly protein [Rhizomicrobium sp.]
MITQNGLRIASLLAVLLAGSCSQFESDNDKPPRLFQDGEVNYPITAAPVYRSLKLANSETLSTNDAADLSAFVDDYLSRGNGSISVSVPTSPYSSRVITAIGERLADLGVPRSHILVGVQDQTGAEGKVEVGYVSFDAHTDPCGDWSENVAFTLQNTPMPNYGCAVQHDIAAQLADPRDLAQPRALGPSDPAQRMQVFNKYEQGQTTQSQKSQSQSGAVSDVGSSSQ